MPSPEKPTGIEEAIQPQQMVDQLELPPLSIADLVSGQLPLMKSLLVCPPPTLDFTSLVPKSDELIVGSIKFDVPKSDELIVGSIKFNDSSCYKGTLKNGVPFGLGTCMWADGNNYDGEWRNGVMHGFGTYMWTSGQRYDGEWRESRRFVRSQSLRLKAAGGDLMGSALSSHEERHSDSTPPLVTPQPSVWHGGDDKSQPTATTPTSAGHPAALQTPINSAPQDHPTGYHAADSSVNDTATVCVTNASPNMGSLVRDSRAPVADSVCDGPAPKLAEKKLYIRKFEDGKLVREDKLTKDEIKNKKNRNREKTTTFVSLKAEKKLCNRNFEDGKLVREGKLTKD
eukprot:gene636-2072_t